LYMTPLALTRSFPEPVRQIGPGAPGVAGDSTRLYRGVGRA
jgi:hypothetical protein